MTVLLVLASACFHATNAERVEIDSRPNIVLIFADDLGYETLGCYGGLDFQTPRLDRMAMEGLRFSRAYTSPVCTPSRVSLHTGLYVMRHRQTDVLPVHLGTNKFVDFRKMPTFAQQLRSAGYLTSVTGKWQLATLEKHPNHIRDSGFDSWCVWQIWKEGAKTVRHWNPTLNHDGRVREDVAKRFGPDVLVDYVIDQMREATEAHTPFLIVHNEMLPHDPIVQTPDDRSTGQSASLGNMIHYLDKLAGRVLDAVDDLGIRKSTYVIFMGDNGTHQQDFRNPRAGRPKERPHTRHTKAGRVDGGKYELNDAGTHVPLIVWGPDQVPVGSVCDDLVDVVDLFPTFCDLAGHSVPDSIPIDGHSLAAQFQGRVGPKRDWVIHGIRSDVNVFDGRWRWSHRSKTLIDASELPEERHINASLSGSSEASTAYQRLSNLFQKVSASRPTAPPQNQK
ncbi:sulfatase-like hydrolase/transferase [Crateriforma spongiae]|uniref:sulfatase-like hydrolase/transferase n=1 Tax=Crateriforma spongiae TaxID=2724528 RepID=UPI001F400764|nr:sulfatase-like hydrolase/transferase [Crateriforma spongiae]